MNKRYFLLSMFLLFGAMLVSAVNFPTPDEMPVVGGSTGNWGNLLLLMHNKTIDTIKNTLTDNGTLKDGIVKSNALNLTNITVSAFSNDANYLTIVGNLNILHNAITSNKLNLTSITLSTFTNDFGYSTVTNGTIQINTGQITGLSDFVVANEKNPSNSTIFIPSSQLTDIGDIQKAAPAFNSANFTTNYDSRNDRFVLTNFTNVYDNRIDRFGNKNFTGQINLYTHSFFNNENFSILLNSNQFYNLVNFTANYDARTDRFSVVNGTALPFSNFRLENLTSLQFSNYKESNFTSQYNIRNDRFGNSNFTAQLALYPYPTNTTISIPTAQITDNNILQRSENGWNANNQSGRETAYFQKSNITASSRVNQGVCWKTATTIGWCSTALNITGGCTCN